MWKLRMAYLVQLMYTISFCLALCFWISELLTTWMVVRCNYPNFWMGRLSCETFKLCADIISLALQNNLIHISWKTSTGLTISLFQSKKKRESSLKAIFLTIFEASYLHKIKIINQQVVNSHEVMTDQTGSLGPGGFGLVFCKRIKDIKGRNFNVMDINWANCYS